MGLTRSYVDMPQYPEVRRIVAEHFEGNDAKVALWFEMANPLLGGMSPAQMLALGRGDRLLKCVRDWQAGDFP